MKDKVTIVGSGASGVHFAESLLNLGCSVELIDVGYSGTPPVEKELDFNGLKDNLNDPSEYFLGENFESVIRADSPEVYEFPPHKQYIFKIPPGFKVRQEGFNPHLSFAMGGLAEAWTGGSYPFNEFDLEEFPFDYKDIEAYYELISGRIGIIGEDDDLSRFFPFHKNLMKPLNLDENSTIIYDNYLQKRQRLNKSGVFLGRSRIATLSDDKDGRSACDYSGRCQWGCPSDSLYVPSITLKKCMKNSRFTYLKGFMVEYFKYNDNQKIESVVTTEIESGKKREFKVNTLALAAGTLSSSKIFLTSVFKKSGTKVKLKGLMDNRQILAPFINWKILGKNFNPESYQYHQLAVGIETENPKDYVHGQITTLKTGLMQPPFQSMPFDFRTSIFLGRYLHSALGVVNINLHDYRRNDNYLTISETENGERAVTDLILRYVPPAEESARVKFNLKKFKNFFSKIGIILPLFQAQSRPMGASVHYSGTIPMTNEAKELTVSKNCRSNDFKNLYIVDGSSFPFLPSKNLTFTLMANAARIADAEFR